jgi:hypothetical protein
MPEYAPFQGRLGRLARMPQDGEDSGRPRGVVKIGTPTAQLRTVDSFQRI